MFRLCMGFIPGMIVAILTGTPMVAWLAAFFMSIVAGMGLLIYRIRNYRGVIIIAMTFFLAGTLASSSTVLDPYTDANSEAGSRLHTTPYTMSYGSEPSDNGITSMVSPGTNGHYVANRDTPSPLNARPDIWQNNSTSPNIGIIKDITRNANGHRATMLLLEKWPESKRVLVYFSGCGDRISIGDTIIFSKPIGDIPRPKNDFEFNAARYYSSLGIRYRVFLKVGDFVHQAFYGFSLSRSGDRFRKAISNKIKERVPNPGSAAIMIAMLIGDKSNIDTKLRTSYSKSGSIHILAISGLHIGIVATILIGLFGLPLPQRSRSLALLKASAVVTGIWIFTWISGMSPSATRAAFMFTIYIVGLLIMRRAHILNILGFTAIFLLVREPYLIYNLGFQFSFLALTGIVIWGMPLLRLLSFKYRIIQYAWSIIAISIGAQILVAPAILYYFNEISILSPVTSLVAIPSAYLIVFGSIILLASELFSPILGSFIGEIMSFGIHKINQLFTAFSELPVSTLNHIYISASEVAILAIIILIFSLRILTDQKILLKFAIPFSFLFAFVHFHQYLNKTAHPLLTIYTDKSEFALDIISPIITQTNLNPESTEHYTMKAAQRNRMQHYSGRVEPFSNSATYPPSPLLDIKIFISASRAVRIIYIGSDPGPWILATEQSAFIVLSKGLDYRTARRLKSEINQPHLIVHDLRSQGAFNLSLL